MEFVIDLVKDPRTGAAVVLAVWLVNTLLENKRLRDVCDKQSTRNHELQERVINALHAATVAQNATSSGLNGLTVAMNALKDAFVIMRRTDV